MKILKKITNILIISVLFILPLYISFKFTLDNDYTNLINVLTYRIDYKSNTKIDLETLYINKVFNNDHFLDSNDTTPINKEVVFNNEKPLIYIYNTHSKEEFSYKKNDVYNITPNVVTASYILEEELTKLGMKSIVEKENITDILNSKEMRFNQSYKVSRSLMENKILEYPSLTYFIDIHRDSVKKNITTTTINGISYAKIMFVLGLENTNYMKNKVVIEEINAYLNNNYPGLSRGIYEKKGSGVDGVYNQDLNNNVMLIEIGGVDNTIEEVSNTMKVVALAIFNYIKV